jgi:hypothetical protein
VLLSGRLLTWCGPSLVEAREALTESLHAPLNPRGSGLS